MARCSLLYMESSASTVLAAVDVSGRRANPALPLTWLESLLGGLGGQIFRRQGLADASERVRGGSGTFKGMNACRKIKDGRSIFPELAT